jgi:malonate decarboxylase alpha subunit
MMSAKGPNARGRKLVVQMVQTFREGMQPTFVHTLDAEEVGQKAGLPLSPVMIYGDDITHVVTEEGIAYLYLASDIEERKQALAAVAGITPVGREISNDCTASLRKKGVVAFPEDLGISRTDARRSRLAANNIRDLVEWSGGLYQPPARFRNW